LAEERMRMMEARLGVTTCDKCQKPMEKGQPVIIVTEGNITASNDTLTLDGSCVHYACHRDCWDGVAEIE
jgi:glutamate 5-kinase